VNYKGFDNFESFVGLNESDKGYYFLEALEDYMNDFDKGLYFKVA
jgi:hypothetical protein